MITPISETQGTGLNFRNRNPSTSREAFQKHIDNGNLKSHRSIVLKGVSTYPGHTAAEVAQKIGLSHVETQRRLSDLCRDGVLLMSGRRRCQVKGSAMSLWWPCL